MQEWLVLADRVQRATKGLAPREINQLQGHLRELTQDLNKLLNDSRREASR